MKSIHSKSLESIKHPAKSISQASLNLSDDKAKKAFYKKFE